MIILITYNEVDENGTETGRELVSYGIDTNTMEEVIIPNEPVSYIGRYDKELEEWVLN